MLCSYVDPRDTLLVPLTKTALPLYMKALQGDVAPSVALTRFTAAITSSDAAQLPGADASAVRTSLRRRRYVIVPIDLTVSATVNDTASGLPPPPELAALLRQPLSDGGWLEALQVLNSLRPHLVMNISLCCSQLCPILRC